MKILLVNRTAFPVIGGVENSLTFIGRELLRSGHKVKILCLQTSKDHPLHIKHEGIDIIRIPYTVHKWPHARIFSSVKTIQIAFKKLLDEFEPDTVWSRSAPASLGVIKSGFSGRILYILPTTAKLDSDSLYFKTKGMPLKRRLLLMALWPSNYFASKRVERLALLKVQPVVFSENMQKAILRSYGKKTLDKTVKIYPGVDTDLFSPKSGKKYLNEIENQYGVSSNENIVLFVGRFSAMKNLYSLIDAMDIVKYKTKLILVGSGPEEDRLKKLVNKRRLTNKIIFVGPQSRLLPGFYSMARVFVNPSLIEPFGQTLLEAQACGLPVIGYGDNFNKFLTATEEIIIDGHTGAVVRTPKVSSLAEKIELILSLNDEEYFLMSKRARDYITTKFSWKAFVQNAIMLSLK